MISGLIRLAVLLSILGVISVVGLAAAAWDKAQPYAGPVLDILDRSEQAGPGRNATVERVADGDTIRVDIYPKSMRLIGVDTPETVHPRQPVECGGPEASRYLKTLLPEGTRVRVTRDTTQGDTDRYQRPLRYVRYDGRDIGRLLVRNGHAHVYQYGRRFRRQTDYEAAERAARRDRAGAWRSCPGGPR